MNLNFAENFKRLRKEKGLTQDKLAEALGVSPQSVSRWELSICYPDVELLPSIANYFGVTVDHLLSNDVRSKEQDLEVFRATVDTLSDNTTERIDFVKGYCAKYPDSDYYAYNLICAIQDHVIGDAERTEAHMAVLLHTVERLMETQYRSSAIQTMVAVCDESELPRWLGLCPYHAGFSRRGSLVTRAALRGNAEEVYVQNGLEMLESMARQLNRRCPDEVGAPRKLTYQSEVLRTVRSFGNDGAVPDGWRLFYAYKQLVLAACQFGCGQMDEGWKNFRAAMDACRYVFSLEDEWLEIGGELFSNLKVSREWNYALDEKGNRHKLFGIVNLSFYNARYILDLLANPRWAWFNAVRDSEEYRDAVAFMESVRAAQRAKE